MSLWEYYLKGGIIMHPITVCLLVAITLTVERALFFKKSIVPVSYLDRIRKHLLQADYDGALLAIGDRIAPVPNILRRGIKTMSEFEFHHGRRIADFERFMKEAILTEGGALYQNIGWLGFVAQIAPLLGLLGTVVGLLDSFMVLAAIGKPEVSQLSGGIAVALITTVYGLIVAIPALLTNEHFQGRADAMLADMERVTVEMANAIIQARTPEVSDIQMATE